MLAITFALLSYFGWGTSDIFGTIATRKIGAFAATFWSTLLGFILLSFYAPFVLHDITRLSLPVFGITIILGIIWCVALFSFNKAVKMANPLLVGAIALSWGTVSVLSSTIFFHERINLLQTIAVIIIFVGIILSSVDIATLLKNKRILLQKGVIFALIAMFGWGIYGAFLKIPVQHIGWFWPLYITYGITPILVFCYMRFARIKLHVPTYKHALPAILATSLLSRTAELSYYIAAGMGFIAIIAPIAGSYSTLFVVLAFVFFRESITKQQIGGVILTVVGIVWLSFASI